ncbi:DUF6984 family protein [Longitalea luteola]|uniref:DUF6984 family protein n=1 Tax=Longitalea luteola TaxID=2812563 RepID=UPI001A975B54|nr:hypothetical protein [Longitalea luteola]
MELNRKPTVQELKLLELLVAKSTVLLPPNWKENLLVCPMKDGGMGSLLLFPNRMRNSERMMGRQVSEIQFTDQDGVQVIASLNVDESDELFELDMWKTDFSKLIKFPDIDNG